MHTNASSNDAFYRSSSLFRSIGAKGRLGLVAAILLLALAAGIAFARHGALPPAAPPSPTSTAPSFFDNLQDLQLLDQDGRAFRPAALGGKVVLLNFVFTGCATSCPTQTRELAALQQSLPASLRRDVRFVSISVDPLGDTPDILRAYGRSAGADFSSWTFATGRPQDIERLGRRLRLFRDAAAPGRPEDHSTQLWLVDGSGRLMQRYAGTSADMARLAGEIGQLRDLGSGSG
jgi:protein SCO1/2